MCICNSVAKILKNEQIAKGNKSIDDRVERSGSRYPVDSSRYPVIGGRYPVFLSLLYTLYSILYTLFLSTSD